MGLFGDKSKEVAKGAGKVVVKSLAWPIIKSASKAQQAYYKRKGKIVKGTCPECGNPVNKDGFMHQKCAKSAKFYAQELNGPHRSDGSSRSGNWFANCNCNRNWASHECEGRLGDPI